MDNMNNIQNADYNDEQTVSYSNAQTTYNEEQKVIYNNTFSEPSNTSFENQTITYNSNNDLNTFDYNNEQSYEKKCGLAIAGFVIALVSLIFDPLIILSILGFIFGLIGLNKSTNRTYKGLAIAAFSISIGTCVFQVIFDTIMTFFTMGIGIVTILF